QRKANRYTARPAFGWERRTGEVEALIVEGGATINVQFFKLGITVIALATKDSIHTAHPSWLT
ncbi:hypothetical protein, partial [Kosakonia radicincitans]|uniref:hypothetical protein n=1 Tax=Kosakonia radicincitans TaxID=283686 RepID=UPI001ABEAC59